MTPTGPARHGRPSSRREFLAALLPAIAGSLALGGRAQAQGQGGGRGDSLAAPLTDPTMIGRYRDPVTAASNDPFIVDIERRLRCTCGCNLDVYTCRTTDFTCTVSPAMHRRVVALADQGMDAAQIIAAFVAEHGEAVLMAPPREGFNLAAYFVPGMAIVLAGGVLLWRLTRRAAVAAAPAPPPPGPDEDLADDPRLRAELADLDS